MRFILLQTHIEYWTSWGKVRTYPINSHNISIVRDLATVYNLVRQPFTDRIMYTEFIV